MDGLIIFLAYSAIALFAGYKMINGKYEWLERQDTKNRVCKWLAVLGAGYVIGAFYLVWMVIKLAFRITDGFR